MSEQTRQAAEAISEGKEAEIPESDRFLVRDFEGGQMARDMTLFVDDDGKAYHIYASEENQTLQIAELTDDYTEHSGRYVRAFVGRSMEAPAIFKHDGKYYLMMSGCTGWAPNAARSAVAKNIAGPWTELKNPCVGPKAGITFGGQSTFILPVQGKPGKFIFMADIVRACQIKSDIEFIAVSSYQNGTSSSGVVQITHDLQQDITGREIVVIEDILDSGNTLYFLKNYFLTKGAKSVTVVTLLDKPARRVKPITADLAGFEVPDEFVVGYGLDYAQQYRNMPYIGVLKPEVYSK